MDEKSALEKARDALDRVLSEDFSHPFHLEVRLDALASALFELPSLKDILSSLKSDSIREILEALVSAGKLKETILATCQDIESLIEQVDYDSFDDETEEELETAVTDLHSEVSTLLDELEDDETAD